MLCARIFQLEGCPLDTSRSVLTPTMIGQLKLIRLANIKLRIVHVPLSLPVVWSKVGPLDRAGAGPRCRIQNVADGGEYLRLAVALM
jgi:hypothetical protein